MDARIGDFVGRYDRQDLLAGADEDSSHGCRFHAGFSQQSAPDWRPDDETRHRQTGRLGALARDKGRFPKSLEQHIDGTSPEWLLVLAKLSGQLVCLEASTGKQVWATDKVTGLKQGASIHLTPNGNGVLLYTDKGELIRAHLDAEGLQGDQPHSSVGAHLSLCRKEGGVASSRLCEPLRFARSDKEIICASLALKP